MTEFPPKLHPGLLPIIRRTIPKLMAESLVSVQPMQEPVANAFFDLYVVPKTYFYFKAERWYFNHWKFRQLRQHWVHYVGIHTCVHDFLFGWICNECGKPWHTVVNRQSKWFEKLLRSWYSRKQDWS